MSAPIKVSTPSVDVQGISLVQGANEVQVYYRKPNGELEASPCIKFYDDGVGISIFLYEMPPGTVFNVDANGRIKIAP